MSVVAIDPGTTSTGLVWMDGHEVFEAGTIRFREAVKGDQGALLERAGAVSAALKGWMRGKEREAVVIEGFVGYARRQSTYTYQTPYLCGYLHRALSGERLVIQTSRQVLNPHTRGNCAWVKEAVAAGEPCGWEGAGLCTNDHERSALAHGVWFYRHGEAAWTPTRS